MNSLISKTSTFFKLGKDKIIALVLVAFTTIVVLSWNDAIRAFIDKYFPERNTLLAYFLTALVLTLILVIMISIFDGNNNP